MTAIESAVMDAEIAHIRVRRVKPLTKLLEAMSASNWDCSECGRKNNQRKECACGKWRPKESMKGDWPCAFCANLNFARRSKCNKCGRDKVSTRAGADGRSAPPPPPQQRPGDWFCVDCAELNFDSRRACHKCGRKRAGDGRCAVCIEESANVTFKPCGHLVVCVGCSTNLRACPVCRADIDESIKTFSVV